MANHANLDQDKGQNKRIKVLYLVKICHVSFIFKFEANINKKFLKTACRSSSVRTRRETYDAASGSYPWSVPDFSLSPPNL